MTLADHINSVPREELDALALFLIKEFNIQEPGTPADVDKPADSAGVVSAMGAWAYMQLHAMDQGD